MSLLLNGVLILGWGCSLALALGTTITHDSLCLVLVIVLLRTQMQTGLFIVAHDAMHGLVCPERIKTNHAIGALALMAYAGVSYARCQRQHQRHHQHPGTALDPDFPADQRRSLLRWYVEFLLGYLSASQMLRLLGCWGFLVCLTATATSLSWRGAALRVLLVGTIPLVLSSLQLFVVGTYLPHRGQCVPEQNAHPISLNLPPWLSLLACFHFGYHREHHENPGLNWFQLPSARAMNLNLVLAMQQQFR
ncbi:fatty acid desaturase [Vulcanococcus sp.]|uniref:fatty acid desaturase n=1 Tax=Vulcanococcus sp. TaxID=2856995 RepID=UPI0037DA67FC